MTDEQKADLAVLTKVISYARESIRDCRLGPNITRNWVDEAEALQRIHDALSARLADAVQPAAGEGGLLPCPFCGGADVHVRQSPKHCMSWVSCVSCGLEAPSETGVTDAQAVVYWNARAALSTSVPAGVVGWHPIKTAPEDTNVLLATSGEWVGEALMLRDADTGEQKWTWAGGAPVHGSTVPYGWQPLPKHLDVTPSAQEPTR